MNTVQQEAQATTISPREVRSKLGYKKTKLGWIPENAFNFQGLEPKVILTGK